MKEPLGISLFMPLDVWSISVMISSLVFVGCRNLNGETATPYFIEATSQRQRRYRAKIRRCAVCCEKGKNHGKDFCTRHD